MSHSRPPPPPQSTPLSQSPPPPPPQSPPAQLPPPIVPPPFTPIELMLFGGISGCVAKTIIAPADNIKILYQVNPSQQFTLSRALNTAQTIVKEHGPLALWRGNSATLLRVFPYASINYTSHELYFHELSTSFQSTLPFASLSKIQQDGIARFIAGGMAGTTSTLVTYPLDVFRARLAASIHAQHPGSSTYSGTVRDVFNTLGFRGIYSGLSPTLLGIFPYNGISFATYHTLKRLYINNLIKQQHGDLTGAHYGGKTVRDEAGDVVHENRLPVLVHLTCGALAALIGQSLTYPLDVVRRRKQVGVLTDMSVLQCFKYIFRNEGAYGFFRGLTMNWVKGPIATAVSFVVNDRLKHIAENHKMRKQFYQ